MSAAEPYASTPAAATGQPEPIAIIGIGCRYPGGIHDLASFWRLLRDEVDAITEMPPGRIDINAFYDPTPATLGKLITRRGGFLSQRLDQFDAAFFGISPREAAAMDPQQRLLLEITWEAFENAGLTQARLAGSRTGVFVGMWTNDYADRVYRATEDLDLYLTTGSGRYAASGRISFTFDLQGPSLTLDTQCSSSLVAVHLACQSLRRGESELAIAGASNLILAPHISIGYSRSNMLAPDGHCKFGDAAANGYVRSEGVGVLVLKPLSRAQADGDRIHALILGSASNNDGRGSGLLVAPSRAGQAALLRAAYRDAGIAPSQVGYVEAHGTGTPAGDPVELAALSEVLGEGRPPGQPCPVGSVKTNFGHCEAAAGLAGLIKTVLCIQQRALPASLHFHQPNPAIPWEQMPVTIQHEYSPWPAYVQTLIAGVSSFGITGSNAHVVLAEAPTPAAMPPSERAAGAFLPLSARSPEALQALAGRYADGLTQEEIDLNDVLYTAARRRSQHAYRLAAPAESKPALAQALQDYAQNGPLAGLTTGQAEAARKTVFIFPGQGSQWLGMGRQLFQAEPAFRAAIQACEQAFKPYVDWSLEEQLFTEEAHSRLAEIDVVQPVLFAIEVALAQTWQAWGVTPDAVVGHSMGEAAAAYIAGALSLEDAARVICARSQLMKRVSGKGSMAVVEQTPEQAQAALAGYEDRLSIAVSNGPRSTVLSGDTDALREVTAQLEAKGVFVRAVKVDVAAHSPHMDALRPELEAALADLQPVEPAVALYSTVTGGKADFLLDAGYWGRNLRQPVQFAAVVEQLATDGYSLLIECSPHPILLAAIEQNTRGSAAGETGRVTIASLRRDEDELSTLHASLEQTYCQGVTLRWERLIPHGRMVDLPAYPWQRERFWTAAAELTAGAPHRALPGTGRLIANRFETPALPGTQIFEAHLTPETLPDLFEGRDDHHLLQPAALDELAQEAAARLEGKMGVESLAVGQELALGTGQAGTLQVILTPGGGFKIAGRADGQSEWIDLAEGRLGAHRAQPEDADEREPAEPEKANPRTRLLAAEPGPARRTLLESLIQEQAAQVLRLPPARVDRHKPLRAQGMDSLMGLEFRNRLESELEMALSATLVWNYPTVSQLTVFLAEQMGIALEPAVGDSLPEPGQQNDAALPALSGTVSAPVDALDEDDLAAALDEELNALDGLL